MSIMQIKNGVILTPRKETDFIGAVGKITVNNPTGNWTDYLPSNERQKIKNYDSYACVSFSALNSIEVQISHQIATGRLNLGCMAFLSDNGYIDQFDKVNFSDRYLAKMSGTKEGQGNSLWAVANSLRHDGLLPEKDWPSTDTDYYAEIPQELKDKALKIYDYFNIPYEWVFNSFEDHLKEAPLQIASAVCSGWESSDIIQKCYEPVAHATLIYGATPEYWNDFDSYFPFRKKLAKDYDLPWVLKIIVKPNQLNFKIMKIIGDEKNKTDQYVVGEDGKIRLIYNLETLLELHNMGIVNCDLPVTWEDITSYSRGDDLICVKSE